MKYIVRPAVKQDCTNIAELYRIASEGLADYMWTQMVVGDEDILDVGIRQHERTDANYSYENCIVVELNDHTIGMLCAYPIHVDPDYIETDPVLLPYSQLEENNSYYICGVALYDEYRNAGIGTELITRAEIKAKEAGFNKTSLIVFEQNSKAKLLYDRLGYKEVLRTAIHPHPLIHHGGDALLMVKHLDADPLPLFRGKNQPGISLQTVD